MVARSLFLSERAVERHINAVFAKLGLSEEADVNRRVMAMLTFLDRDDADNQRVGPAAPGAPSKGLLPRRDEPGDGKPGRRPDHCRVLSK